ncbi:MAG: hypothetical protein WBM14_04705, partial [Terracidiphilus sp.]
AASPRILFISAKLFSLLLILYLPDEGNYAMSRAFCKLQNEPQSLAKESVDREVVGRSGTGHGWTAMSHV